MIRTFIYGSCVSRDTFERLPKNDFELLHYVARQSLISSLSPPPAQPPPPFDTPSAFQRRMLQGDWDSSLLPLLRAHADRIDLLLWDLCDERLGLRQLHSALDSDAVSFETRSVDSLRAGVDEQLGDAPLISFGSVRHRLQFFRSLRRFVSALTELRLMHKVVVLAPPWATYTSDRNETPSSFGMRADRANRLYADYHSTIERVARVPVIRVPETDVLADPEHPWGVAPFHYVEDVYVRMAEDIRLRAGRVGH